MTNHSARIDAIAQAAQALIANRNGIKTAQEQGKGFTVNLQHVYLDALKNDDKQAIEFVDSKIWKKGDEQGEYYGIRGVFSKVRAIHAAGLDVAPAESFDKAYKAALEKRKASPSPKDVETAALKAFAEANGVTLRDVRAMTLAEQTDAVNQGMALMQAKASNTVVLSEEELLAGIIALIKADRHAAFDVLEKAMAVYDEENEKAAATLAA